MMMWSRFIRILSERLKGSKAFLQSIVKVERPNAKALSFFRLMLGESLAFTLCFYHRDFTEFERPKCI